MLTRLIDYLKGQDITAMFTHLGESAGADLERTEEGISSLMDAWILLRDSEHSGRRNFALFVLKARGMDHSNQIREFVLTDHGVKLVDVYVGPAGLLTGSARVAQAAREKAEALERKQELERKSAELTHKRQQLEEQIDRMRAEFAVEERGLMRELDIMETRQNQVVLDRTEMGRFRQADITSGHKNGRAAREKALA